MFRRLLDQLLEGLTYLVLRGFFRTVEVVGLERVPKGRPVLVVANHFYGFVDPVMLIYVLGRVPRFLAKATLWRSVVVRPFLALAGMVPVGSTGDGARTTRTAAAFARSSRVLSRNGLVAVFPEGTTHDVPRLAPLRSGAARLALHARAEGTSNLTILPIGLVYDDKLALRSRALARVGEPIDLDAALVELDASAQADHADRELVGRLTELIEQRLRAVSPDYRDMRQAAVLSRAAEIALRGHDGDGMVPLVDRDRLAQRLAHAPEDVIDRLIDVVGRYILDLDVMGLRDHQLASTVSQRALLGGVITTAAQVAVLAPLAMIGLAVNIVPFLLTQTAGRAAAEPVSKGTTRMLVALAAFPATWFAVAWLVTRSSDAMWIGAVGTVVVAAVSGMATVYCLERLIRVGRAWRGRTALRDRRALLADVRADRHRLVRAVAAAEATINEVHAGAAEP
jgi:1-acyl-sn-glycerol-3-phosphate acyltransferase